MNITRIFEEFKKGNICVFKNSIEARHYLIEYAKTGNSIEQKRAITIDNFKNYFVEDKDNKTPISPVMRQLFIDNFLKNNKLDYFINDSFPESLDRLSLYLSKLLPFLKRIRECDAYKLIDSKMVSDVELLFLEYSHFLEENNLYESNYNEYKIENAKDFVLKENYSIIGSDTMEDFDSFYSSINEMPNIYLIKSLSQESTIPIESFANCAEENSVQLRRISYLLHQGVAFEDIAITLGDFNNQIQDILRESKKFNIPLVHRPFFLLKNYSQCKYFCSLKNLYYERFSLSSMKTFFLDGNYRFKDTSIIRQLIRIGIDANVDHGRIDDINDSWVNKLNPEKVRNSQKEKYQLLSNFYVNFKKIIIAINIADNKEDLNSSLESLYNSLFDANEESFKTSDIYKKVIKEFNKYYDAMEDCKFLKQRNLFSHLIDFIDDVKFESNEKKEADGIKVYSYPESSCLCYKYHFILGMNHGATEIIYKPLDILPSSVDESLRQEVNLTYPILNDYLTNDGNKYVSYGCENYNGSQLPPSFFIEKNLSSKKNFEIPLIKNSYKLEELYFAGEKESFSPFPLQKEGFNNAKTTILEDTKFDMVDNNIVDPLILSDFLNILTNEKGEIKLSSTSIDTYQKCPYKWAIRYIMKIYDKPFDIVPLDHREVGTFLHKVMEVFFYKVKMEDKRFFSANIEKYETMLSTIFDEELLKYSSDIKSPTKSSLIYIEDTFKPKVMNILQNECGNFDGLESLGFEKHLEYHDALVTKNSRIPFFIDGLIDRIVALEDNGFAIIDYKKSNATIKEKAFRNGIEKTGKLKSYQFPCYRLLMDKNEMNARTAAYFGFNDGKYEFVFKKDDQAFQEKIDEIFSSVLTDMLISIKKGQFKATPSKQNCEGCYYRQICRKRYSTK